MLLRCADNQQRVGATCESFADSYADFAHRHAPEANAPRSIHCVRMTFAPLAAERFASEHGGRHSARKSHGFVQNREPPRIYDL